VNLISIVIPVYNEEDCIKNLIEEIYKVVKLNFELILVDDGSNDNTNQILEQLKNIYHFTIISNKFNKGQSFSIKKGIENSIYETIVTLDADGQNNPKDILLLFNKYFQNSSIKMVGGIRINRKDSTVKIYSSKIANFIRMAILNDNCKDTGCSLKIFDKNIFLKFPYFNGIHRFIPALFSGYGYKTAFVNVSHRARITGVSKYGTFDRLFRGIIDIYKVKKIISRKDLDD